MLALGHGLAVPACTACVQGALKAAGIVQSMSRKGNCIDNGATEQVFGHIKDEFFRGQDMARLRVVQGGPRRLRGSLEHEEAPG